MKTTFYKVIKHERTGSQLCIRAVISDLNENGTVDLTAGYSKLDTNYTIALKILDSSYSREYKQLTDCADLLAIMKQVELFENTFTQRENERFEKITRLQDALKIFAFN